MAGLVSFANADRDIVQDGTSLIWFSSSGERSLKLASVSRIIPGQRTAVFRRYLCPEKEYLSFSLLYDHGNRSLDLICKDKVEADIWIAGLKTLISSSQAGRSKIDGWSDEGLHFDDNRDLTPNSLNNCYLSATRSSPEVSISSNMISSLKSYHAGDTSVHREVSHVALAQTNMQVNGYGSDAFRVSASSGPSNSSHCSAPNDSDALGEVYIWGEVFCDNLVYTGPEENAGPIIARADVLLPKPLECNVVLDVHQIACGFRHATLVTRQGEIFSWGEESGGRLGYGVGKDLSQPHLVESLSFCNVDFVACGEFHSCAVTTAGELYTWGDGTHNAGLLGHGTDLCHWVPKRVSGSLDGRQVATVSCGPWHTALITTTGHMFTFGDGTFGALGHGNRESVMYPKEIESLSGLRTTSIACGVWHTAAVVEVMVAGSCATVLSGKLFTWGDGDKNRLGHGEKQPRLKPTCVPTLIDYDFHQVSCGHSLTIGLTTSGRVFTMGSTVYGQLGNPQSDGMTPCLVENNIAGESVEQIACGAYHVAVLTSKNEVYTWGKGANGRLGHGDVEDRKMPTFLEALKDRHVKSIVCGTNYSAAICQHKWVSGVEQSQCSACRQSFGFTRKRHNCYNCGLVHCHACSSKKATRVSLAPNPSKPYRVCDSCFTKLSKVAEAGVKCRRNHSVLPLPADNKDKLHKADFILEKSAMPCSLDPIEQFDKKVAKRGKKADAVCSTIDGLQTFPKPILVPSSVNSTAVSPLPRKYSPPRTASPGPTISGLSFLETSAESLKISELLNQEVNELRVEVDNLKNRYELQELELKNSAKKAQEAMMLAAEESAKSKAAKEVIKSLTAQLKDMAKMLPPAVCGTESFKLVHLPNGLEPNETNGNSDTILPNDGSSVWSCRSNTPKRVDATESEHKEAADNDLRSKNNNACGQIEAECNEKYERGVCVTLVSLQDGTRDLKRVRFSHKRFREHQAERWWLENRDKVYERYNIRVSDKVSVFGRTALRYDGALSPSSQV
ncbi:PH, RCC1 and FYVE domains-containing protein 1-like isoform X2 [Henckelia pumila]|uniref:PH, RCC1 and FYVE domains-containing protein 1-like isoform X2 n=1 Tax=Henckelia pumila TaxID=405737 RepID=UPI003C6E9EE1